MNRTPEHARLGGAYSITATGKIRLHVKIPIVDFGLPNGSREGNVQSGGAHGRWQGRYGAINLFFITVCLIFLFFKSFHTLTKKNHYTVIAEDLKVFFKDLW